jgi:hypothetical protein
MLSKQNPTSSMQSEQQLMKTEGMKKAGLRRDAIRSQVIDALEAQEIKETGNEEDARKCFIIRLLGSRVNAAILLGDVNSHSAD